MSTEPFVFRNDGQSAPMFYLERWMHSYPGLTVGFSSRQGGVSEAEMQSLNCALHVQDNPSFVLENRRIVAKAAGFSFDAWTCAEQVHGTEVMVVTRAERGKGKQLRENAIQDKDALITNESDILLTAFFADCVPIFLFDPVAKAIGIVHAGWKGTVRNVVQSAIDAMGSAFASRAQDIRAAIGPSIGMCCYEVDDAIIQQVPFKDAYEMKNNGKAMLNLKQCNRQFMIKAGILPTHIELCELCTSCRTDLFFSHRKEKGRTGRMVGWIGLKMR